MLSMRGLTYSLNGHLYVAVTNRLISASPIALRGPSFVMPADSGFSKLADMHGNEDVEPTSDDIFTAVDNAFESGRVAVSSMESEPVTFAGYGEPLLRVGTICDAVKQIKDNRHGALIRIKTNGLILNDDSTSVAQTLKDVGVDQVSISLLSDNPKQYQEIMKPQNKATFSDVCSFIITCAEVGLDVECTAVESPDVQMPNVRSLAMALGATSFRSVKYFP